MESQQIGLLVEKLAGLTAFARASGESRQPLIKKL